MPILKHLWNKQDTNLGRPLKCTKCKLSKQLWNYNFKNNFCNEKVPILKGKMSNFETSLRLTKCQFWNYIEIQQNANFEMGKIPILKQFSNENVTILEKKLKLTKFQF